jgi:stress-induced morphogen
MDITEELLETKIKENLPGVEFVKATDQSDGCGGKFEIEIISSEFSAGSKLQHHRLVHKAIKVEMEFIHALTLKCKAPTST